MNDTSKPYRAGRRLLGAVPVMVLILLIATPGQSQTLGDGAVWNVQIGAGVAYQPTFEGAADTEVQGLPFFSVTYGDRLSLGVDGLVYHVYQQGPLQVSTRLGYDFGRAEADDPHLAGLGDIDGGATLGLGADYAIGPAEVFARLDKSFGDVDGLVGTVGAGVSQPLGNVLLGAEISATWADSTHMQGYFGVTAAQSAASGLAAYDAGAGVKRVDLALSAMYQISDNWSLRGEIGLGKLIGDAADSPVLQDSTQTSASILVGFSF
jgi:MipA family protein